MPIGSLGALQLQQESGPPSNSAIAYTYDELGQLTSRTRAGNTLATTQRYLPNSGDRRLSGVDNTGLTAGQYSNYAFTTTPENMPTASGWP